MKFYLPISSGDGIKQKYIKIPNAKSTAAGTSMANCKWKDEICTNQDEKKHFRKLNAQYNKMNEYKRY